MSRNSMEMNYNEIKTTTKNFTTFLSVISLQTFVTISQHPHDNLQNAYRMHFKNA